MMIMVADGSEGLAASWSKICARMTTESSNARRPLCQPGRRRTAGRGASTVRSWSMSQPAGEGSAVTSPCPVRRGQGVASVLAGILVRAPMNETHMVAGPDPFRPDDLAQRHLAVRADSRRGRLTPRRSTSARCSTRIPSSRVRSHGLASPGSTAGFGDEPPTPFDSLIGSLFRIHHHDRHRSCNLG
jgi:hypothetical protein